MNLSVQQSMLPPGTLSERFQRAVEYGLSGVELSTRGLPRPLSDHIAEIERAMQASGLPVSSLCTSSQDDFVHPDPAERGKRLKGLVEALQVADELGADGVVALPIRPPVRLPDLSPVADEDALITQLAVAMLREALDQTADCRAAIFLEPLNRYESRYLRTVTKAAELCRGAGNPRAQVMGDFFHMGIEEANVSHALDSVAPLLGHIHLADSNRLLPGHGHTDFVAPFRVLRRNGFTGWMALECGVPGELADALPAAVRFLGASWDRAGEPVS